MSSPGAGRANEAITSVSEHQLAFGVCTYQLRLCYVYLMIISPTMLTLYV